jgi:hypothetical protein
VNNFHQFEHAVQIQDAIRQPYGQAKNIH